MSKEKAVTKRPYYPKTRTGCATCRIRKVKCDEAKPHCRKCTSTGRKCDGYPIPANSAASRSSRIVIRPTELPTINSEAVRYMEFYFHQTAPSFSGSFDSSFWSRTVLQLSKTESAIRHAMLAISYYHEQEALKTAGRHDKLSPSAESTSFGLEQYNKAIAALSDRISGKPQPRIPALMTCILFVALEMLRGNASTAMKHHQSGLKILAEFNLRPGLPSQMVESPSDYSQESDNTTDAKFALEVLVPLFARMTTLSAFVGQGFLPLYPSSPIQDIPIPESFDNLLQARASLVDITNLSLLFISTMMQKHMTNSPILIDDLINQSKIQSWFSDWEAALQSLEDKDWGHSTVATGASNTLRMQSHLIYIWLSTSTVGSEGAYAAHTPTFIEIVNLAEQTILLNNHSQTPSQSQRPQQKASFLFDSELIGPLFWTSMKCRHLPTRKRAIALLHTLDRREGLWHSRQCAAVAEQLFLFQTQTSPLSHSPHYSPNAAMLAREREKGQVRIHIAAVDPRDDEGDYDAGFVPNTRNTHVDAFLQKEYKQSKSAKGGVRAYGTWISWHLKE